MRMNLTDAVLLGDQIQQYHVGITMSAAAFDCSTLSTGVAACLTACLITT